MSSPSKSSQSSQQSSFHVVYTEDELWSRLDQWQSELKLRLENIEHAMTSLHQDIQEIHKYLSNVSSYVLSKQQMDARQQNINLRLAIPTPFVPEHTRAGLPLLFSGRYNSAVKHGANSASNSASIKDKENLE